jgi:hypothetical protein
VRDGRCNSCPPGQIMLRDGQCCDPRNLRDGRCNSCPPGQITLRDGQCCDPRNVRDGRCNSCPPGQIMRDGRCVPPPPGCPPGETSRDGRCVPTPPSCSSGEILRDGKCVPTTTITRTPLRHLKVEEPREPGRHGTAFHTRIPSGVTVGRTPSGGRGTIAPHFGRKLR